MLCFTPMGYFTNLMMYPKLLDQITLNDIDYQVYARMKPIVIKQITVGYWENYNGNIVIQG